MPGCTKSGTTARVLRMRLRWALCYHFLQYVEVPYALIVWSYLRSTQPDFTALLRNILLRYGGSKPAITIEYPLSGYKVILMRYGGRKPLSEKEKPNYLDLLYYTDTEKYQWDTVQLKRENIHIRLVLRIIRRYSGSKPA